jgi:hypothetical protein
MAERPFFGEKFLRPGGASGGETKGGEEGVLGTFIAGGVVGKVVGFRAQRRSGGSGLSRVCTGHRPEVEGDADRRGRPVSGRQERPRTVSVRGRVGQWAAFWLGLKRLPRGLFSFFLLFYFSPFLFSLLFCNFFKTDSNSFKPMLIIL